MGGQSSKLKELKIDRARWSKMEEKDGYDIMWDKQGEQAQLYRFILDETLDINNQIDVNNFRAKKEGNHVRVFGAQETAQKVGLCGTQKNVEVLTERIPVTLYDSRQLSFQQANIVLYNALKGYSRLSDKFGPIEVNNKMIGFSFQGNTRVWINENFGKNHPVAFKDHDTNNLTDIKTNNEQRMVRNILSVVEKKSERGEFPSPYRNDIYKTSSFSQALQFVQSSNVVPFSILEQNKVDLDKPAQQSVIRASIPQPVTTINRPVTNTRVSFNYISPGASRV